MKLVYTGDNMEFVGAFKRLAIFTPSLDFVLHYSSLHCFLVTYGILELGLGPDNS